MSAPANRQNAPDEEKERSERLEERVKFLTHATYFVGLSVLFAFLDWLSSGGITWSKYLIVAWGVFVYVHFLRAFVVADLQGPFKRWLSRREESPEHKAYNIKGRRKNEADSR